MTQDELQMLKADLCGRLPYGGITIKLGNYDYIVNTLIKKQIKISLKNTVTMILILWIKVI